MSDLEAIANISSSFLDDPREEAKEISVKNYHPKKSQLISEDLVKVEIGILNSEI